VPEGFRFRAGWFGRLVLQRRDEWHDPHRGGPDGKCVQWRDATPKDLTDFFQQQPKKETP